MSFSKKKKKTRKRARTKNDSTTTTTTRKRLLHSDESIIDTEQLTARMDQLMKERRNSDSMLNQRSNRFNKDPMRSIWYWAEAEIYVDPDVVFPKPWFENPIETMMKRNPGNHLVTMRYLDVMLLAVFSHCARKYGKRFTEEPIIKVTFRNLTSLTWEECEQVKCSPSIVNIKRMLFFIMLSCEPDFQRTLSKQYEDPKALNRFTVFLDQLQEKNRILFNTPFSSQHATTTNNVGLVVNNYISDVMYTAMLFVE